MRTYAYSGVNCNYIILYLENQVKLHKISWIFLEKTCENKEILEARAPIGSATAALLLQYRTVP